MNFVILKLIQKIHTPTVASTSSATKSFITRCLSLSKSHYFYCIKIRALLRTSPMFLWELKNGIISQNLRELCDIKTNTKNPHTHSGFDKLSHQIFYYTAPERSRRHIISIALKSVCFLEHLWCSFDNSKTPLFHKIFVNFVILKQIQKIHTPTVASTSSATNSSITRCLSLPKAHYFYCIKIRALLRTSLMFLW